MEKTFENYKNLSFCQALKNEKIIFFAISLKSLLPSWADTRLELKKAKLKNTKVTNSLALKILKRTKFKACTPLFTSSIIALVPSKKYSLKNLSTLKLANLFMIGVKINNSLYPVCWTYKTKFAFLETSLQLSKTMLKKSKIFSKVSSKYN